MVTANNFDPSISGQGLVEADPPPAEQKSAENLKDFAEILGNLKEQAGLTAEELAALAVNETAAQNIRGDNGILRSWQIDPFQGMEGDNLAALPLKDKAGDAAIRGQLTAKNQQLGQSMAALLAKARGAEIYGHRELGEAADGQNLLNFMLQQNLPLTPGMIGDTLPVLDLSTLDTYDLSTIINRITAYLAQNHWANRPSLTLQVLQKDLGKFFVRADALPNGKIDVQILSSASEFFMQHQDTIRTALTDAGIKLGDLKIMEQNKLDTESFLAQHHGQGEQGRSDQQLAQDDRARRFRLWQQAYRQQEA